MPANVLYLNLADSGTVDASSWIAASPPALLQDQHISRRWKGRSGDTEFIILDLGALSVIDTIGLFGCARTRLADDIQETMDETATTRVRVSSVDSTGVAGDLYDSGPETGQISSAYGQLIKLLPAPITGRYVRIDLMETGSIALLAGRLVVGLREAFTYNFSFGWAFGFADLSRKRKSAGGQTFVERDDRYRILTLSFDVLAQVDRYSFVQEIDRINGLSEDILFVLSLNSTDFGRDCIWGLIQDQSPPTQPNLDVFAKAYNLEERR